MQSGIFYGYLGLVEGMVARIGEELGYAPYVIATGGHAELLGRQTDAIDEVVPLLTLDGLRLLWERNR